MALVAIPAARAPADSGERHTGKSDNILMQGAWKLEKLEFHQNGTVYVPKQFSGTRIVEGTKYTLKLKIDGNEGGGLYSFTLRPEKQPKEFDVVMPNGQTVLGIYRLKGDVLERSYAQPGAPRPTDFRQDGQHYQIWRRIPPGTNPAAPGP